jgi:hypothetical protein
MRNSMIAVFFALGVALSLGCASSASAQALDLAECRSNCQEATAGFVDQCHALAGPARGYCRRVARAYNRCCKRKFCRGKVDISACIRNGV